MVLSDETNPCPDPEDLQKSMTPLERQEIILVVDDDQDVIAFITNTLEARGHRVITTDSPEYALDLFTGMSGQINVVVADILMPVMNGTELTSIFKELRPEVRILAITGLEGVMKKPPSADLLLKKPFDGETLVSSLRRLF